MRSARRDYDIRCLPYLAGLTGKKLIGKDSKLWITFFNAALNQRRDKFYLYKANIRTLVFENCTQTLIDKKLMLTIDSL